MMRMVSSHHPNSLLYRFPAFARVLVGSIYLAAVLAACKAAPTASALPTAAPATPRPTLAASAAPQVSPPAATVTLESAIPVQPADLHGVKIIFGHTLTGEAAAALNTLEARFNGTNPWGIWVEAVPFTGFAELSQAAVGGENQAGGVDVAALPVEYLASLARQGVSPVNLARYMEDPLWGLKVRRIDKSIPENWQAFNLNGFQAAAPFNPSVRYLAYNQSWAHELGFDQPPASLQDFEEQACAAARQNLDDEHWVDRGTGGWVIDSDPLTILSWIAAFGGETDYPPGSSLQFDTGPTRQAFAYLKDLFDRGCIWTARKADHASYLAGRQALLITAETQDIPRFAYEMAAAKNQDTWLLIPFPRQSGSPVQVQGGTGLAVFSSSEIRQLAGWLFIRWMQEPDNQAILIKAGYSLPTSQAGLEAARRQMPSQAAWLAAAGSLSGLQPGPRQMQWLAARDVLEDAFLQLFKTGTEAGSEAAILQQADSILAELAGRQP